MSNQDKLENILGKTFVFPIKNGEKVEYGRATLEKFSKPPYNNAICVRDSSGFPYGKLGVNIEFDWFFETVPVILKDYDRSEVWAAEMIKSGALQHTNLFVTIGHSRGTVYELAIDKLTFV